MKEVTNFPRQQLPFSKKTKAWRKQCCDWADSKTFFNYNLVRKSVIAKKINYDLINGILHMNDLQNILNPNGLDTKYLAEDIPHYPIMNSKLNVLRGEESKRVFDYRVIVTNPNAISEIEENKKAEIFSRLQQLVSNTSQSEEAYNKEIEELNKYYIYNWQDLREIRANAFLNHYTKEYNIPLLFNQGFMDALTVGEEIYQCDIVGGEPIIERINPLKIRVFKSGYSSKIEDADVIILEDYWSPGKIIDTYYESLTEKDIKHIEELPDSANSSTTDSMDNIDERNGYVLANMIDETFNSNFENNNLDLFSEIQESSLSPYDLAGNIRVLKVFWKSKRKIKKVKSYDQNTGEEIYNFYPETYIINKDIGEEEKVFYINEAWEGTKIGEDIYINMRPRIIQYNRLENPSKCHFGIIGSVYNLNDDKPFSLVDMMKQYNYLYDAVHDRLNKKIANSWGKIIQVDLAKIPKGWDIEKWLYYARVTNMAVTNSFNEGNYGAATGKLVGALNNASSGVLDAELGNSIQSDINLLEYIKNEMSEVAGISRQREGQISNRETVGGVERATLQSSHITEWFFTVHDDIKKRVLECFLETSKIALRGRNKKFQYILPDSSLKILDIEGDEFAESDYGLVVDNSNNTQALNQKLEGLAQAALQGGLINFSTVMKLYNSSSLAEKQKMIEQAENESMQRQAESAQQANQLEQQKLQVEAEKEAKELEMQNQINIRDNETKLLLANIAKADDSEDDFRHFSEEEKEKLKESIRQFDEKIKLEKEKLSLNKKKVEGDLKLKEKQINNNKYNRY